MIHTVKGFGIISKAEVDVFLEFSCSGGSEVKASASNMGDLASIPGLGGSPGGRYGNPLQYSCLENSMDRGAWNATVHGVAKSQTQLSDSAHKQRKRLHLDG